jgi:hypothetical protein
MKHVGDEQPPGEHVSPFLPTEIEHPDLANERARRYLPNEQERHYVPTEYARPLLPTEIEHPDAPIRAGSANQPTDTGPGEPAARSSYRPAHARPTGQPAQPRRPDPAPEITRYGPGVHAPAPTGPAHPAERIWRTGHADESPRRPRRWRGRASAALTVILLAASAVVLYLRFHHAPFHVTGAAITQRTPSGCDVNVTGEISTNGAAGTVSYQWLFQPDRQAPQPLTKAVAAGQNALYVTAAVEGSGHGSASRTVTLQVLGPDLRTASTSVIIRC